METAQHTFRESAKRRLMFIAGEDYYFLTYTMLILLGELGCTSVQKPLVDSRKVAYLAELLGNDSDLNLATSTVQPSPPGHARLVLLHDRAVARLPGVSRLIRALSQRGLVTSTKEAGQCDSMWLGAPSELRPLLANEIFSPERERLRIVRKRLPQLRTMSLGTMKSRLFGEKGVHTWDD